MCGLAKHVRLGTPQVPSTFSSLYAPMILLSIKDTTPLDLISNYDQSIDRMEVELLSEPKTTEIHQFFSIQQPCNPQRAHLSVKSAEFFKYLGPITPCNLNWDNTNCITKNDSAKIVFPAPAGEKKINLLQTVLMQFYTAITNSILISSIIVWLGAQAKGKLQCIKCSLKKKKKKKNYRV